MKRKALIPLAAAVVAAAAVGAAIADPSDTALTSVPSPNLKATGYAPANVLSRELREQIVAEGADRLENPQGIVTNYGYENDVPSPDDPSVPQEAPVGTPPAEAQKTEPRQEHLPCPRRPEGRGSRLRLRDALPVPGARVRSGGG